MGFLKRLFASTHPPSMTENVAPPAPRDSFGPFKAIFQDSSAYLAFLWMGSDPRQLLQFDCDNTGEIVDMWWTDVRSQFVSLSIDSPQLSIVGGAACRAEP